MALVDSGAKKLDEPKADLGDNLKKAHHKRGMSWGDFDNDFGTKK